MFQSRSERKFLLHCLEELSSFMPPCVHAKIAPTNLKCLPPAAAITNLQLGRKDVNIRLKDSEVAVGPIIEYSYGHLAGPHSSLFLDFQIQRQCICKLTILLVEITFLEDICENKREASLMLRVCSHGGRGIPPTSVECGFFDLDLKFIGAISCHQLRM